MVLYSQCPGLARGLCCIYRSLTAALGFAVGDAIAQHSTKSSRQRYDYVRTMRMSGFGLLFAGPLQGHYWFRYLDKVGLQASQTSKKE